MASSERKRQRYGGKTEPYKKVRIGHRVTRNHRLLAEAKLGRPLQPGEVVHHIEGKTDTVENLEVYPSHRHHMIAEHYQRRERRGIQHLWALEELLKLVPPKPCK